MYKYKYIYRTYHLEIGIMGSQTGGLEIPEPCYTESNPSPLEGPMILRDWFKLKKDSSTNMLREVSTMVQWNQLGVDLRTSDYSKFWNQFQLNIANVCHPCRSKEEIEIAEFQGIEPDSNSSSSVATPWHAHTLGN